MKYQAIIIGASTSGKSTLVKFLREKLQASIQEMDEELIRLNGGNYPKDSDYKMNILSPKIVTEVLNKDSIIFFTNTDYFRPEDLRTARQNGFIIILLTLDRKEMEKRNKHRVENEGYDDLSKYFDNMADYIKEIQNQDLFDVIVDTNKPVQDLEKEILKILAK